MAWQVRNPTAIKFPLQAHKAPIKGKDAFIGNNNEKFIMFGINQNFLYICNGK